MHRHPLATQAGIAALAHHIRARCALVPQVALLLGTGLGALAERIQAEVEIPYAQIPGMPQSTAASHKGSVILGQLSGVRVVAFSGRLHLYEGYSAAEVVAPVRIAKALGAQSLFMGSATGGLNPLHPLGSLVLLDDHINLMGTSPLQGPNDDALGPRWPDMIEPYCRNLQRLAQEEALRLGQPLQRGVYVGVLGPNLETRAEYRMLRALGADVVGMSTVPEAIAAVHCGLKTLAVAIVTDRCLADALEPVNIAQLIATANAAEPRLADLFCAVIARLK